LAPSLRTLVRTCEQARDYRRKVALTLVIWWSLPVLAWEYSTMVQLEGLAVIPGHTLAAAALPFEAGLLAVLSTTGLSWQPLSLVSSIKRIWARFAWVVYALFAGPLLLAMIQVPSSWPP
jgi:hypothetical protein